jgi:hypothetical protein
LEDEVKLHPKRFDTTHIGWIIFVIGIFLNQLWCQILLISTEMAKRICGCWKYRTALELAKVKLLTSHFSLLTLDKMLMH